ncbi:hypothetical protein NOCARDAX2BIS_400218 [Nocardioides sp. AX2bis]|nr:hypothetical protein NOCARDAX2BIS_400218 [Nocardioides sp. AX2bis]
MAAIRCCPAWWRRASPTGRRHRPRGATKEPARCPGRLLRLRLPDRFSPRRRSGPPGPWQHVQWGPRTLDENARGAAREAGEQHVNGPPKSG